MARTALQQVCPHCGVIGDHKQQKTEKRKSLKDLYAPCRFLEPAFIQRLFGNQSLCYRERMHECNSCGMYFETVQMTSKDFFALFHECKRLDEEKAKLESELLRHSEFQNQLGERYERYRENIQEINDFVSALAAVIDPDAAQLLSKQNVHV